MRLEILSQEFSVCKVADISEINTQGTFLFIGKTDEEISVVCEQDCIPVHTIKREDGWKALRVIGILDFSLVGILSKISGALADHGISIFAVSTFNTDYILIKTEQIRQAKSVLQQTGYVFLS